jgi:hypothetical protein
MNERIEKLAIECYQAPEFDYKKFAQLIVQECLAIAKNWEDQLDSANSLSESNAVGIVAYRIARQFGVKQ